MGAGGAGPGIEGCGALEHQLGRGASAGGGRETMSLGRLPGVKSEGQNGGEVALGDCLGIVAVGPVEKLQSDAVDGILRALAGENDGIGRRCPARRSGLRVEGPVVVGECEAKRRGRPGSAIGGEGVIAARQHLEGAAAPGDIAVGRLGDVVNDGSRRLLLGKCDREEQSGRAAVGRIPREIADEA